MSRTLDSDVGGKVYGIAFYRLESGSPPTGVSGESLLAGASGDNGSGFGFYVFEKDSAGSSTTISPTITFATSDAAAGFVAFSVRPAGAGGKAARLLI